MFKKIIEKISLIFKKNQNELLAKKLLIKEKKKKDSEEKNKTDTNTPDDIYPLW